MESAQKSKIEFEDEIRKRIDTLRKLGIPELVIQHLTYREGAIVDRLFKMQPLAGDVAVIPVLPPHFMSLRQQLKLLGVKKVVGATVDEFSHYTTEYTEILPYKAYFMLDVRSGQAFSGQSLDSLSTPGLDLNISECLALMLHAPDLVLGGMWAGAVRKTGDDEMGIYLKFVGPGILRVEWKEVDQGVEGVGIPTCASRQ